MKDKQEIVSNWLPRYTGLPLEAFGEHILLTNFSGYLDTFSRLTGAEVLYRDKPMPTATFDGITMINFGMGSANAATMMATHCTTVMFMKVAVSYVSVSSSSRPNCSSDKPPAR